MSESAQVQCPRCGQRVTVTYVKPRMASSEFATTRVTGELSHDQPGNCMLKYSVVVALDSKDLDVVKYLVESKDDA